jgi:hypothetical protein
MQQKNDQINKEQIEAEDTEADNLIQHLPLIQWHLQLIGIFLDSLNTVDQEIHCRQC